MKRSALALFVSLLLTAASLPAGARAQGATAADLVGRMPARDQPTERELMAELVKLGPAGLGEVVSMLAPPGSGKNDSKVRYALDGLAAYVFRPGAERERVLYAKVLADGLGKATNDDVKAFLIARLGYCGKDEAVEALKSYTAHERLYEPAARALVSIATQRASGAVLEGLKVADAKRRVTFINAAGVLRIEAATPLLLEKLTIQEESTRNAALMALADLGAKGAEETIRKLSMADATRERTLGTTLYLRYAMGLARRGDTEAAAKICRELIAERRDPRERHVVCAALSTLVAAIGRDALDDVFAAVEGKDLEVQAVGLRLTSSLSGQDVTRRAIAALKGATDDLKVVILRMLGERGDPTALPAVLEAAHDAALEVKLAAITAASRLEGKPPLPTLLAVLRETAGNERAQLLLQLRKIGGRQALQAVLEETRSNDAPVKVVAIRVLTGWPDVDALEPIFDLFKSSGESGPRAQALKGYVRLIRGARFPQERVYSLYASGLEACEDDNERKVLIMALGQLKTAIALEKVASFLEVETLRRDAATAAIQLVLPRKSGRGGLAGKATVQALEKAIPLCPDADLRRRGEDYLSKLRKRD